MQFLNVTHEIFNSHHSTSGYHPPRRHHIMLLITTCAKYTNTYEISTKEEAPQETYLSAVFDLDITGLAHAWSTSAAPFYGKHLARTLRVPCACHIW